MNTLNITINGKPCTAKPGQTILQACRDNGVSIPTLCHDERLRPFGSCLLCRIEVEGARSTMLACGTEVTEGMVIRTETDAVNSARRACLELLLSQHHGDCKAPCTLTCPNHMDVQGYVAHIANGRFEDALRVIKETNPLPVVCGRICTRPCEGQCRRNIVDEPIAIAQLKRFAADIDLEKEVHYLPERKPATGKRVAIVGAGPAGLTAAWFLAIAGHSVTIFERHAKPGGMLRYGIPAYRMPRETLDREIDIICQLGVEIKYNVEFGKDITWESLKKEGYDALFLAVGSQVGRPLGCDGEGVCFNVVRGVDFLGRVTEGTAPDLTGKDVVVVGGGNTAMDAARTSVRMGARSVKIVYRRGRSEMPADKAEIEDAEHEGVELCLMTNPVSVGMRDGRTVLTLVKMAFGEPDESGRPSVHEVPGSEYEMEADYVIAAIGQTQDLSFINESFPVAVKRNMIVADEKTFATNIPGVFAAGDAVTGPKTAIQAIAGGRFAARSIDQYLRGEEITPEPEVYNHTKGRKLSEIDPKEYDDVERRPRSVMPTLPVEQRVKSFDEVELGFSVEEAMAEAKRCLSCGCQDAGECKLREYATTYKADQFHFAGELVRHPIDETHPYLVRDRNKCIMCGRCVRICLEVQGQGALGFIGRGYGTTVEPSRPEFGNEEQCVRCGQCVSTCPVGALTEKVPLTKPGPFAEKVTETVCSYCGAGCKLELRTTGDTFLRATSHEELGINTGNLCVKGRFNHDYLNDADRLVSAKVRKNGALVDVSLEEALEAAVKGLKGAQGDGFAVYISGRATNEQAKALAEIAAGRGSENVLSFGADPVAAALFRLHPDKLAAGYGDIWESDLIVALGADILADSSVPLTLVRRKVREGTPFICEAAVTDAMRDAVSKAKAPLIVLGKCPKAQAAQEAVELAEKTGAKILVETRKANERGIAQYLNVCASAAGLDKADAVLIFGEDPAGCGIEMPKAGFTVVCDLYMTDTARQADVVLPMGAPAEEEGTFTNIFGDVQSLRRAFCGRPSFEKILRALSEQLGAKEPYKGACTGIPDGKAAPFAADILEKRFEARK
ncbi:MAG: FAD-dependent oxidoreductase [Clostridiales bacterium]|nr:FAD-dependent oxidoreductase [Clostridiales bacterium]